MSVRDLFLVNISPSGKPIFIDGAAEDINRQQFGVLFGDKVIDNTLPGEKVVDKTLGSLQLREIGGYLVNQSTLKAGTTVLEAILLATQIYREQVEADGGFIHNIEELDEAYTALLGDGDRVGNIFNKFQVDGKNAWQLLYDGTGYFAGGKFSWDFDNGAFQVKIDGEVIAQTGILKDLAVEGTLLMGAGGTIESSNFTGSTGYRLSDTNVLIFDGALFNADIGNLTVLNDIVLEGGSIYSDGYTAGSVGWSINSAGTAEFNNVTVRGTVEAEDGFLGSLIINGGLLMGGGGSIYDASFQYSLNTDGLTFFITGNDIVNPSGGTSLKFQGTIGAFPVLETLAYVTAVNDAVDIAELIMYGETGFKIGTSGNTDLMSYSKNSVSNLDRLLFNIKTRITNSTNSTSSTTGALQVAGGIGVGGNSWFGGTSTFGGSTIVPNATANNHALNRITADGRYRENVLVTNYSLQRIDNADSPFTVTTQRIVACDTTMAGVTVNLPNATTGVMITIFDRGGDASTNNIIINAASGQSIEGSSGIDIITDYGSVTLVMDANMWIII
jgi:hypothetical protein